jgi:DNA-binding NarL/FixJ family response regulator
MLCRLSGRCLILPTSSTHTPAKGPVKRLFVVDDHPMIREGLAAQISIDPGLELCGEAVDVEEAYSAIVSSLPDLVIVDISLRHGSGIELIERLKANAPDLPILVWSMHSEQYYAESALRAGARGYVNKSKSAHQIMDAIHTVLNGGT